MVIDLSKWKLSDDESIFARRIRPHYNIGFKALFIPFVLTGIVLANGDALSAMMTVDQNSILFWLWPFNRVYVRQFAESSYSVTDVKWFFTVVSISNLIWLIFISWKFVFELIRKDIEFPPGRMPVIYQAIVRVVAASCFILTVFIFVGVLGFNEQRASLFFGLSLNQSITFGANKVLMMMFGAYFSVALLLEFGGLGLRWLLSKAFGWFSVKNSERVE